MKRKATRREVAALAAELDRRLEDTQVLLAAAVLQYGDHGKLTVHGSYMESITRLAPTHTIAVRVLTNGDMRVDFSEPELAELTIKVIDEEATCSST